MKLPVLSWVLLVLSVIFLAATAILVNHRGNLVYYLAFHKPLHMSLASAKAAPPATLPSFLVQATISQQQVSVGDVQHITLTATAAQNVQGFIKVWVRSPKN